MESPLEFGKCKRRPAGGAHAGTFLHSCLMGTNQERQRLICVLVWRMHSMLGPHFAENTLVGSLEDLLGKELKVTQLLSACRV